MDVVDLKIVPIKDATSCVSFCLRSSSHTRAKIRRCRGKSEADEGRKLKESVKRAHNRRSTFD